MYFRIYSSTTHHLFGKTSDCEPSEEDIRITKRLKDAGKIMGIEVLDHIIVTNTGYYSFKGKGLL